MNLIVAVSENYGIGKDNKLLFNLPMDLKYFKEKTQNKVVVMGRKTFESLPFKPLKNRVNIVITTDKEFHYEGIVVVNSFEELFEKLKDYNDEDVFLIGGSSIYNKLMERCRLAYITKVHKKVDADTFITNLENKPNWEEINSSGILNENGLDFEFKIFENQEIKQ